MGTLMASGLMSILQAQNNLTPNANFEIHTACGGWISAAVGWTNPTIASPDYHHACEISNTYGVPYNLSGMQYAHSDSAYAGIVSFTPGAREYIQVELTDTLELGFTYCVTYFVSLAGKSDYGVMAPQVHFSDTAISTNSWMGFISPPHIENLQVITDTTNWIAITGEYTAQGGERFLTIGHFYDNASTTIDTIGSNNNPVAYFYIDDVSTIKKLNSNAGINSTICMNDSTQLGSSLDSGVIYLWSPSLGLSDSTFPNPWAKPLVTTTYYLTISDTGNLYCSGNLVDSVTITVNDCTPVLPLNVPTLLNGNELFYITSLPTNSTLRIFDTRGRLVLNEENYQNDFSVANLDAAVYIYELTLPDLTVQKGKFCVVK